MAFAILTWNPRKPHKETHLEKNQPRLFALPNPEKFYQPPSHVCVWDFHPSGTIVVLASTATLIPDTRLRVSFARHRKGWKPSEEARMLANLMYRRSEEGKLSYDKRIGEGPGILV